MKAWTDYPFSDIGDKEGKEAPVREVEVVSYDGDKYCKVKICSDGREHSIKTGYIYQAKGRYGEVPAITHSQLSTFFAKSSIGD